MLFPCVITRRLPNRFCCLQTFYSFSSLTLFFSSLPFEETWKKERRIVEALAISQLIVEVNLAFPSFLVVEGSWLLLQAKAKWRGLSENHFHRDMEMMTRREHWHLLSHQNFVSASYLFA